MRNELEYFNYSTLGQLVEDKDTLDFSQMFEKYKMVLGQTTKYAAKIMKQQDLEHKLQEFQKGTITNDELKAIFNRILFFSIPENMMSDNELMELFIEQISENQQNNFADFSKLYQEYKIVKNKKEFLERFETASDDVQLRIANEFPAYYFQDFIDRASLNVQDELFLQIAQNGDCFAYSFSSEIFEKYEKLISREITTALENKMNLVDVIGGKACLNRYSNQLFRKIPDEVQLDYLEQISKAELDIIKKENLEWNEVEENLSGNELLEILDSDYFKQKEGEVYHLNFETPYLNLNKLFELAEKYKLSCSFTVRSCAELPMKIVMFLEKNKSIDISSVQFKSDDLNDEQKQPYDIDTYKKCLRVIDIMTGDIEEAAGVDPNDPDRDKKVAGVLLKRFANLTSYNYDYIYRSDHGQATKEEGIVNRNLVGALLEGTCVCAGDAEAVRNLFLCSGIREVEYVSARNKNPKEAGHAWNRAKLDGEWTDIDITWDRKRIKQMMEPKFCFKSDSEFGHEDFIPERKTPKCEKSVKNVSKYMKYRKFEQNRSMIDLIKHGTRNCGIGCEEVNQYKSTRIATKEKDDLQK